MRYQSNLRAPDLRPQFAATTEWRVRDWSMGHDIPSDKEFEPECGFLSDDEAAILHNIVQAVGGRWLDIGARFGWSTAHIALASLSVHAVDHALRLAAFAHRFETNMERFWQHLDEYHGHKALKFFAYEQGKFAGVMIDGDHDRPQPLNDACCSLAHLEPRGAIVFHDFWGRPIQEGVEYLIQQGLKCRVYNTPAGMAVCWRGEFTPPDHVPDPDVNWSEIRKGRAPLFDFGRTI